jgi:serine/threonine-protein kinase
LESGSASAEHNDTAALSPERIGRYTVMEMLGEGGMGVVYKAFDGHLGREVALKLIRAKMDADAGERTSFMRETYLLAKLQHPNIVQIFDWDKYFDERGVFNYNVQELVEGGTLAAKVRDKPMPPVEAARLILTLAHALHYAHTRGVLHRDLKPTNILLTPEGTPKIADFGLARDTDVDPGDTLTGGIVGTPAYMAPEQVMDNRDQIGPATDVFSLGVIFYELLTGRRPFEGPGIMQRLKAVLEQDPPLPSRVVGGVPRALDRICMRCLSKDPTQRYTSAAALAHELEHFLKGGHAEGRPRGIWGRLTRWLTFRK